MVEFKYVHGKSKIEIFMEYEYVSVIRNYDFHRVSIAMWNNRSEVRAESHSEDELDTKLCIVRENEYETKSEGSYVMPHRE